MKARVWRPAVPALFFSLVSLFFTAPGLSTQQEEAEARKIVEKMDELYRSKSSRGTMEMQIVTPNWQRTLKFELWSEGMEKTFIRVLEPLKERGTATLRIGNEMWNFLPNIDKVMKIPPSMMMGSWMGSDFTNDDLVKEYTFLEDYSFALTQVEKPEPGLVYVKCVPHEGVPVVWGYIVVAVREADYLPVWENYYDEKGRLMREIFFREVKRFGSRVIPSVMELIPTTKEGHKTVIRYLEMEFDIPLDPGIFTMRNLRTRI